MTPQSVNEHSTLFRQLTRTMKNSTGSEASDRELESDPIDLDDYPDKGWWDDAFQSGDVGNDEFINDVARILGADEREVDQLIRSVKGSRVAFHQVFSTIALHLDDGSLSPHSVITRMDMAAMISMCRLAVYDLSDISKILVSGYPISDVIILTFQNDIRDEADWRMILEEGVPVEWVIASRQHDA